MDTGRQRNTKKQKDTTGQHEKPWSQHTSGLNIFEIITGIMEKGNFCS